MRKILLNAKVIIGHNIIRYDVPVWERLLGIKIKARLVDTLALSWYLYPDRLKHGIESWGTDFGIAKPFILDWENLTIEEYNHRCIEDVKINKKLWNQMFRYLMDLYGTQDKVWAFLDYLSQKMKVAALQEVSKWKLDIENVKNALEELQGIQEEKKEALTRAMPTVPKYTKKTKPKRFLNNQGDYTKLGMAWVKLLSEKNLPFDTEEVEVLSGEEPGNPSASGQLKAWLDSLGWKPRTFKYVKNKETGELRAIPQINLEHGKGICGSIKDLYEKEPSLELLDGLSVLSHRIGILKGFLRDEENGWIMAQVKGLTNTLRFQHTTIVNLPKVGKLYADSIRGSLIADDGYILCGADKSSLEDRIKQHFIFPHDPDYVKSMNEEGFDPHLVVAVIAGMCSQADADNYKWYNNLKPEEQAVADAVKRDWAKKTKPIRDIAKNGNYACQYGAGASRLVLTCGISLEAAQVLHKAYWKLNWAIKEVASEQITKTINDQMWLLNPISGFWYSLRFVKDIFSTLVQGTASYVFDIWVNNIMEVREQITAQFHDEVVLHVKQGEQEEIRKILYEALDKLNKKVNLNRELDISVQFGSRYSDIH